MHTATAPLPSARIRYRLDGPPQAPVVMFCNSLMADHRMWDAIVPLMADGWRLLRHDMRGHGASSAPPGDYAISDLVQDAEQLLDHLGIRQVHLVGISLGGMVALQMAARSPERVASLVVGDTGTRMAQATRDAWDSRAREARDQGVHGLAEATLSRWFTADFLCREPAMVEAVRQMLLAVDPVGYAGCAAAIRDLDIDDLPEKIQTRTLVLHGLQDGAWPADGARELANRIGAKLHFIDPAAHIPCIEQPMDYAQALRAFLDAPR